MEIVEKIKEIREFEKKYTQQYVADQLGIDKRTYNYIENGQTELSYKRLEQIAKILEVPVNYIINYKEATSGISNNFYLQQGNLGVGVQYQGNCFDQVLSLQGRLIILEDKICQLEKQIQGHSTKKNS